MEQAVFPMPDVQARLREYVLLRVDVDRAPPGLKARARALPTYIIYDWDERDRFHFFGGMPAKEFLNRLDLARDGMPFMIRAADLFAQKQDVEAWMQVAKGYRNVGAAEQSREAWQRAQRAAESTGDRVTAQIASINGAVTWVMEGKPAKAVTLLKKITASPVDHETGGMGWLALGQTYLAMNDPTRAREAFETAKTLVPPDHVIAKQADAALARATAH